MKAQRKLDRDRARREAGRERPRSASDVPRDGDSEAELGDALDLQVTRSVLGYDE